MCVVVYVVLYVVLYVVVYVVVVYVVLYVCSSVCVVVYVWVCSETPNCTHSTLTYTNRACSIVSTLYYFVLEERPSFSLW